MNYETWSDRIDRTWREATPAHPARRREEKIRFPKLTPIDPRVEQ